MIENRIFSQLLKPSTQVIFTVPAIIFVSALVDSRFMYLLFGAWLCSLFGYGLSILILVLSPTKLLESLPKLYFWTGKVLNIASILIFGGILGSLYLWLYTELKMPGSDLLR